MTQFEVLKRSKLASRAGAPVVVQRRLMVGAVSDPAEAEADRLADEALQRMSSSPTETPMTRTEATSSKVRRFADGVGAGGGEVAPELARQIDGARSGGAALDGATRQRMEAGFGADFSNVRVHSGGDADSLNQSLQARAFTTGDDIFFRGGEYRPGSASGDRLLAHELAHTVQQGAAPVRRQHEDDTIRRAFTVAQADWGEAKAIQKIGAGSANGVFILRGKSGSLVIKGQSGAARTQMAADMMEASGAHSVQTRAIVLASPEGAQLLQVMTKLAKAADKKLPKKTPENQTATAAVNLLASAKYDSVAVMPAYDNLSNLLDVARSDQVLEYVERMKKNGFFNGLGRIHAADMMMGNEDRLARGDGLEPSLKNTFMNTWSGQAVGLDLDMNAHTFEQVTGDIRKDDSTRASGKEQTQAANAPSLDQHKYKDYVTFIVKGGSAKKKYMKPVKGGPAEEAEGRMVARGSGMNSGDMGLAADPAKAATVFDTLVAALVEEVRQSGNQADSDALRNSNWAPSKAQFVAGVADGLAALSKKMQQMSARSTQLTTEMGGDPFLDPRAFRVRDMYVKLLKLHDEPTTMKLLEKYAELLQNGGSDEDFWAWHDLLYPPRTAPTQPAPQLPATGELAKPKRGFAAIRTPIGGRAKPRIAPAKPTTPAPKQTAPQRPTIAPIRSTGGRAKPRIKEG